MGKSRKIMNLQHNAGPMKTLNKTWMDLIRKRAMWLRERDRIEKSKRQKLSMYTEEDLI